MNLLKKIVSKVLSRKIMIAPANRLIFAYHDVSDFDSSQYSELYSTTIANFKAQIELLAAHFELVSLEEIVSVKSSSQKKLACITFDDGFLSVKDNALPFLESRGIPFAIFANKMAIQKNTLNYSSRFSELNKNYETKVYLDEDDLIYLSKKGILIGNHSASHKILAECGEFSLREEILDNKEYLEKLLNKKITHLALPYGKREHYNQKVLDFCFSVGHNFVYSSNPTFFGSAILDVEQPLIPRIGLTNQTLSELRFLINRPLLKKVDI